MTAPHRSRRALAALALFGTACVGVAACSGGAGSGAGQATSTTETTAAEGLQVGLYSDPSVPVTVDVGRRFALLLPADPAHGWRWVVQPVDTRYLAPLGSEFRDDAALLSAATTTTTAPPPPEETTTTTRRGAPSTTSTSTTTTSTTEPPSTTTTAPGPLVQIVSFAGKAPGATTVTVRYERIGGEGDAGPQTMVFNVVVGPLLLPPVADTPPPAG